MAAENCVICLIGAMDRLWFHQIILFSEPSSLHLPEITKITLPQPDYSSKNTSQMPVISEQETSPSVIHSSQDETSSQESDVIITSKTRSHSSSPISAQKQPRNFRYSNYSAKKLQKSMSCKSLVELELEEVKGFMDLGFIFRKENLSKRMVNLIPGLQRIDAYKNEENDDFEEEKGIMRPYLSEAWVLQVTDFSLMNLGVPRVSNNVDMKKHLKYWARTVASVIQQES